MSHIHIENSENIFRSPSIKAEQNQMPQKLILINNQSPGDVTMLTAAVRDLHAGYPAKFLTDVRSACPDLWLHNPHLTSLDETTQGVKIIECRYPLINRSNEWPYHFLHGFTHFLNRELKLAIRPRAYRGDIHLSPEELQTPSLIKTILDREIPFWIVVAGGKNDYTVKWWCTKRYQGVIDGLKNKVLFVQIGQEGDHHPPLSNVLDLRGKTTLRELVLLIHHSQGVLCPVTAAMHLAAAVPTRSDAPKLRPCVVVAGGREPPHWESYPNHQFIHTVGMLNCCETGGCWRKRTLPLGDGDKRDLPENLCQQVVEGSLPRCMHMITSQDVINRINGYFSGGAIRTLSSSDRKLIKSKGIISN